MYNFSAISSLDADEAAILGALSTVLSTVYVIALIFSVICYVFQAVGLYTMAKRRGFDRPWYAWIPVANVWLLGRLSDQYQWVAKRTKKNRGKTLLWLQLITIISAVAMFFVAIALTASTVDSVTNTSAIITESEATGVVGISLIFMLLYFIVLGVGIAYTIFYYIALYDVFASCDPSKKVLFLVLSILLGIQPFFIFALRNKDLGMRPEPQYQYPPQNMYYQGGYNPGGYNPGGYNDPNQYNPNNFNNNQYNPNNYNGYNGYNYGDQYNQNNVNNSQYGYNPNNWNQNQNPTDNNQNTEN